MSSIICSEIVNINGFGITAKSGKEDVEICFDECAKNHFSLWISIKSES